MIKTAYKNMFFMLFVALIQLISCKSYAGDFGWTTDISTDWSGMVSGSHTIYTRLVSQSNANQCTSNNYGIRDAVLYKATSTTTYCDRAFQRSSDCDPDASSYISASAGDKRNKVRDCLTDRATAYAYCKNVVSASDKTEWESDLTQLASDALNQGIGLVPWDTDELIGMYFGGIIWDLAKDGVLGNDFVAPSGKTPVGGVDATGTNTSTLRNAVKYYITTRSQDGEFVEGSEYNMGTMLYMLMGVHVINDYYGTDKFPEITALCSKISDSYYQKLTPDYSTRHQWGDTQGDQLNNPMVFRALSLYSVIGRVCGGADIWHYFDAIDTSSCVRSTYPLFYDPNATRTKGSGQTSHGTSSKDDSMGLTYWHEGWNTNDTFFASMQRSEYFADHDWDAMENFRVWRNDDWVIYNPQHYFSSRVSDSPYMNGLLAFSAITGMLEARGQMAYESGSNYMYHAGLTSGLWQTQNVDDGVPDFLKELSSQKLFRNNADGSETIFHYHRVKGCRPDYTGCMSSWKYGTRFKNAALRYWQRMEAKDLAHQYVINADTLPTRNGNEFNWTADNGDAVELYTFIDSYTPQMVNMNTISYYSKPYYFDSQPVTASEMTKYQLRLEFTSANEHTLYTPLNVISIGGSNTYTEILDNNGDEDVQGAEVETSNEHIVVLFNAEDDTTTTFTSTHLGGATGFLTQYDSQRFSKAEAMSHFKVGSTVQFTTNDTKNIEVYILGLDHTLSWTITKNGSSAGCTVSDQGVCKFTITGASQTHTVTWVAGSAVCSPQSCSVCSNQTTCEAETGCEWTGSVCQTASSNCSSSSCGDCDQSECNALSGSCVWNGGACEAVDQCTITPSACTTQSACETAGWCWENNICAAQCSPPVGGTVTLYPSSDTFIRSGIYATTNYDTQGLAVKDATNSADFDRVALMTFDLSSIPANADIQSVELKMKISQNGNSVQGSVHVFKVLRTWVEGQATWNIYSTGNNWGTAGAQASSDHDGTVSTGVGKFASYSIGGAESVGQTVTFTSTADFTTYIQANVGGSINIGLYQPSSTTGSNFFTYDSENATATNRPTLTITYALDVPQGSAKPPTVGGGTISGGSIGG